MAGAIGVAAVLAARQVSITCPHCGHVKRVERKPVERKPVAYRVCPRCHRQFPDPLQHKR